MSVKRGIGPPADSVWLNMRYIQALYLCQAEEVKETKITEEQITEERLRRIWRILESAYGHKTCHRKDPVETLVRTILSHNTNDRNCDAAFKDLVEKFRRYEELLTASDDEIAHAIRKAGLSRVKAKRLKNALSALYYASICYQKHQQHKRHKQHKHSEKQPGRNTAIDMRFLDEMSVEEAREFLMSIPGIGQKTASCILCFSFGKGAFPVDTHIQRIFRRMFSINEVNRIAHIVEMSIPPEEICGFHLNLIEHGRKICRARNPLCDKCALRGECAFAHTS